MLNRNILLITTKNDLPLYKNYLYRQDLGLKIAQSTTQTEELPKPFDRKKFLNNDKCILILG